MSFRDNLLHLRATNNMTQEQLAMLLGVSRQSVTKWEAEKSYPEMDKLIKMCQIFDCTLDELVQGDLTGREAVPSTNAALGTPADLFGYDELMRSFAKRISLGIAAPIACVGIAICLFALGDSSHVGLTPLYENIAAALGILVIFIGAAICLGLIIPAGIKHGSFVKAHPYLEDFYTADERASAHRSFTIQLICGILSICLGICCIIVLGDTSLATIAGIPLLMLFIAVGVCLIVHGALTFSRVDIEDYNEEAGEHLAWGDVDASDLSDGQKEALFKKQVVARRRGAICGIIMIVATIVALVMLFLFGNEMFWMSWVIGGLLCGIVSLAFQAAGKE